MSEEPDVIGDWIRERVLGSGGFGVVTLWRNIRNHDRIAVKKYREESTVNLTSKQRERWTQEVQMMQRIKNGNIVNFRELPPDLAELHKYNPSKLPMLSMEYCSKGDLRSVLVRSENSCGLPESDVRTILSDLKHAVSYLHTLKITHRDLKPENIVLQFCERPNNIIYKLIDLGYAKELDAKSISASFVGTLQYLAPELLYSKTYSCSVDYWSMGQVAFEIICGTRPFLPNMSPAQWMFHAHKKSAETICIYQQTEKPDSIKYSNEIFTECHVSSCFKREIETWLKLALEYNPRKRGYKDFSPDRSDNELTIFTALNQILEKKIVTVFLVHTCEFSSYEIDNFTQISTLQKWVERDTKLPHIDQVLLSPFCGQIDPNGLAIQVFDKTYRDTMLYIFKKTQIISDDIKLKNVPQLVKNMLDGSAKELMYYFKKRSYAHALYFIYKETQLYNSVLDACSLKIKSMLQLCDRTTENCKVMKQNLDKLISQKEFSKELLNFDCKQYLKNYSQTATHWLDSFNSIKDKIQKLFGVCTQITIRFDSATRRAYLLNNAFCKDFSKHNSHDLNELLDMALLSYDEIRKKAKDNRTKPESCKNMLKILYDVLKSRDKLLRDTQFQDILQKIVDMGHELDKILPTITSAKEHIEKFNKDLLLDNLGRQSKIWEFTIKPKTILPKSPLPEPIKPTFILGNQHSLKEDIGAPISLSKPLHFILGESQMNSSLESNNSFHSPCGSPAKNSIDETVNCNQNEVNSVGVIAQTNRVIIPEPIAPSIKSVAVETQSNMANKPKEIAQNIIEMTAQAQTCVPISGRCAQNSKIIIPEQATLNNKIVTVDTKEVIVTIPEEIIQNSRANILGLKVPNNKSLAIETPNNIVNIPEELSQNSSANILGQKVPNNKSLAVETPNNIVNIPEELSQNSSANILGQKEPNNKTLAVETPNNIVNIPEELSQNVSVNILDQKEPCNKTEAVETKNNIPKELSQSSSVNMLDQEEPCNKTDAVELQNKIANIPEEISQNNSAAIVDQKEPYNKTVAMKPQNKTANIPEEIPQNSSANILDQEEPCNKKEAVETQNNIANIPEELSQNSSANMFGQKGLYNKTDAVEPHNKIANIFEVIPQNSANMLDQKESNNKTLGVETLNNIVSIPVEVPQSSVIISEQIAQNIITNNEITQNIGTNAAKYIAQTIEETNTIIEDKKMENSDFKSLENVTKEPKINNEEETIRIRLPNFQIGAPTSDIIQYNTILRFELLEKTNDSFIKCKSILNETLDFGFLDE